MQIAGLVILLFILTFLLIKSTDLALESIRGLAKKFNLHSFGISAIILAIATSLPEFFVGIASATSGTSSLSLGNLLGANIANLGLVVGLSAIIANGVAVKEKIIFKEMILAAIAGFLPILLLIDGSIGRVDGVILLLVYITYASSFFKIRFQEIGRHHFGRGLFIKFVKNIEETEQRAQKGVIHLLAGVGGLLISAHFIVKYSADLAFLLGVPIFVIGLILLSIGTTLPELVVSIESIKKRESGVFFGNILGSLVVNSTLILGVVALISPIEGVLVKNYLAVFIAFFTAFLLFWLFTRTKLRLERWEAVFLLAIYIIFAVLEFI